MKDSQEPAASGKSRRGSRLKHVLMGVFLLVAAAFIGLAFYASDSYQPTGEALQAERSSDAVTVIPLDGGDVAFLPAEGGAVRQPSAALAFYPGGKVEADAYAPLMGRLAGRGVACVLLRVPLNLAVLDEDAALRGRGELSGLLEARGADAGALPWAIGGHSLGGVMAAGCAAEDPSRWSDLVMLASYPTADLSQSGMSAITLVGSDDGVLDRQAARDNAHNLPDGFQRWDVIEGGIHSYFGCYGIQKGDGEPAITNDEQLDEAANAICRSIQAA